MGYQLEVGAPVRDHRIRPVSSELFAIVRRHARMTAVAITASLRGLGDGQGPRQTGRSLGKPSPAPMGREAHFD